ncbi:MAG: hypothetical protein HDS92_06035 [Bacteroidales bacterium]|nr:hypothetical protein [Bacteroidales bacterium]
MKKQFTTLSVLGLLLMLVLPFTAKAADVWHQTNDDRLKVEVNDPANPENHFMVEFAFKTQVNDDNHSYPNYWVYFKDMDGNGISPKELGILNLNRTFIFKKVGENNQEEQLADWADVSKVQDNGNSDIHGWKDLNILAGGNYRYYVILSLELPNAEGEGYHAYNVVVNQTYDWSISDVNYEPFNIVWGEPVVTATTINVPYEFVPVNEGAVYDGYSFKVAIDVAGKGWTEYSEGQTGIVYVKDLQPNTHYQLWEKGYFTDAEGEVHTTTSTNYNFPVTTLGGVPDATATWTFDLNPQENGTYLNYNIVTEGLEGATDVVYHIYCVEGGESNPRLTDTTEAIGNVFYELTDNVQVWFKSYMTYKVNGEERRVNINPYDVAMWLEKKPATVDPEPGINQDATLSYTTDAPAAVAVEGDKVRITFPYELSSLENVASISFGAVATELIADNGNRWPTDTAPLAGEFTLAAPNAQTGNIDMILENVNLNPGATTTLYMKSAITFTDGTRKETNGRVWVIVPVNGTVNPEPDPTNPIAFFEEFKSSEDKMVNHANITIETVEGSYNDVDPETGNNVEVTGDVENAVIDWEIPEGGNNGVSGDYYKLDFGRGGNQEFPSAPFAPDFNYVIGNTADGAIQGYIDLTDLYKDNAVPHPFYDLSVKINNYYYPCVFVPDVNTLWDNVKGEYVVPEGTEVLAYFSTKHFVGSGDSNAASVPATFADGRVISYSFSMPYDFCAVATNTFTYTVEGSSRDRKTLFDLLDVDEDGVVEGFHAQSGQIKQYFTDGGYLIGGEAPEGCDWSHVGRPVDYNGEGWNPTHNYMIATPVVEEGSEEEVPVTISYELENGAVLPADYVPMAYIYTEKNDDGSWDVTKGVYGPYSFKALPDVANMYTLTTKDTFPQDSEIGVVLRGEYTSTVNGLGYTTNEPIAYTFSNVDNTTGIDTIGAEGGNNADAPVVYYNLQGMRLAAPVAGQIVIRVQGSEVSKVLVK